MNFRPKVHYINSGGSDKNLGGHYNDTIKHLPDEEWICVSDQDALWFPEFVLKQVEDAINTHGNKYKLMGAYTNRIAAERQRAFPSKFDNMDIFEFRKDAEKLHKDRYNRVKPIKDIAGFFMLFSKELWNRVQFRCNTIACDTFFCQDIKRLGYKIGLIEGIYVYHWYRAQSNDPTHYKEHLI
ncbi:MAG TPA: hypothetical protein VK031_08980, partial [Tissierellaceae bacterium]|nr:hypothetical protein [Tissierellaceae bacterium]